MKERKLGMSDHRTQGYSDDVAPLLAQSYAGMAHFAGSGPAGKTCGDCTHRGYKRQTDRVLFDMGKELPRKFYRVYGCEQFKKLSGLHGADVPKSACACKYFSHKNKR